MVTKGQNRKDHSVSAIFLIYSIFSHRNQISSLRSHKAYDKLILMTVKKVGCPCSLMSYSHFQPTELNIKAILPYVFRVRVHEGTLNDSINYVQRGCAV